MSREDIAGKARQIYLLLRNDIVGGRLAIGDRLPPETEIAHEHGVSRMTVRRALAELEHERLIARRPSAGTRVIADGRDGAIVADIANLVSHIHEMGKRTRVRLISFGYEIAAPAIRAALGLEVAARVQRSERVRLVEGQPLSYLTTFVPEAIGRTYDEAELGRSALIQLLERSGVVVARAEQAIGATLAQPDVARALDVAIGAPLLELRRSVYDAMGRGVEHLHALYRPDRYAFRMELLRTGHAGERAWQPAAAFEAQLTNGAGANRLKLNGS